MSDSPTAAGELLTVGDIAQLAGVSSSAVSNWRKRHSDFPVPVQFAPGGDLFARSDVEAYLSRRRKSIGKAAVGQDEDRAKAVWHANEMLRRQGGRLTQGRLLTWLQLLYLRRCTDPALDPTRGRLGHLWGRILSDPERGRDEWRRTIEEGSDGLDGELRQALMPAPRVPIEDLGIAAFLEEFLSLGDDPHRHSAFWADQLVWWQEGARATGESVSSRSVAELAVRLLEPLEGVLYDPAFGVGSMLVQGWKRRASDQLKIVGQEVSIFAWKVAYLRLLLHGVRPDLRTGDTLLDDQFPSLTADRIALEPPWGERGRKTLPPDARWPFDAPPRREEWLWVYHAVHHMADRGRAVVIVPSRVTDGPMDVTHRRHFMEMDVVDAVIDLPPGVSAQTSLAATILIVDRDRRNRRGNVLFVDARVLGKSRRGGPRMLEDDQVDRIVEAVTEWRYGAHTPEARFSARASVIDIEAAGATWAPSRFIRYVVPSLKIDGEPVVHRMDRLLEEAGPGVPTDAVERLSRMLALAGQLRRADGRDWRGMRLEALLTDRPRTGWRKDRAPIAKGMRPYVTLDDVRSSQGRLVQIPAERIAGVPAARLARRGDLLLGARGIGEHERPACSVVDLDTPLAYAETLMLLRPTDRVDPDYLRLYLTSREGHMALLAITSGNILSSIRPDALANLEIPLPDLPTQRDIVSTARVAEAAIRDLKEFSHRITDLADTLHEGLISGVFAPHGADP